MHNINKYNRFDELLNYCTGTGSNRDLVVDEIDDIFECFVDEDWVVLKNDILNKSYDWLEVFSCIYIEESSEQRGRYLEVWLKCLANKHEVDLFGDAILDKYSITEIRIYAARNIWIRNYFRLIYNQGYSTHSYILNLFLLNIFQDWHSFLTMGQTQKEILERNIGKGVCLVQFHEGKYLIELKSDHLKFKELGISTWLINPNIYQSIAYAVNFDGESPTFVLVKDGEVISTDTAKLSSKNRISEIIKLLNEFSQFDVIEDAE